VVPWLEKVKHTRIFTRHDPSTGSFGRAAPTDIAKTLVSASLLTEGIETLSQFIWGRHLRCSRGQRKRVQKSIEALQSLILRELTHPLPAVVFRTTAAAPSRPYEGARGGPLMGIPFSQEGWKKPEGYSLEVRVAEQRAWKPKGNRRAHPLYGTTLAVVSAKHHLAHISDFMALAARAERRVTPMSLGSTP
jgi:hypothetical protein